MKITQKQFDKLNQLDRIEYRQKEERIKEFMGESIGYGFLKYAVVLILFAALLLPQGYSAFGKEFVLDIINVCGLGIQFFIFFGVIGYGADLAFWIVRKRKLLDLHEEYFKVKVNKK